MEAPHTLSLRALVEVVSTGSLTAKVPAVESLERIAALDRHLNAVVETRAEAPREARAGGPLAGVPIGLKDFFVVAGRPPTAGSRVSARGLSGTAEVVRRLRSAGAAITCFTNLHEWGLSTSSIPTATGPIRNPWDRSRVAGGSSGGSAAALAAGLVTGAVGTDAGGSIRCPASCCGVAGLKPTWGAVPEDGYACAGSPVDHIGPMARSVGDLVPLLEVLTGEPVAEVDPGGLRIGLARGFFIDDAQAEVAAAVEAAVGLLARVVSSVTDVGVPGAEDALPGLAAIVLPFTADLLGPDLSDRPEEFQPASLELLRLGAATPPEERARAEEARGDFRSAWRQVFDEVDVVVTPTLPAVAAPVDEPIVELPSGSSPAEIAYIRWNAPMNLAGVPALSMPCALGPGGLPIGVTLTAAWGREAALLALGAALERALDGAFANRIAPIDA